MVPSKSNLSAQIHQLSQQYVELFKQKHGHLPVVEKDENWPSPCLSGEYSKEADYWHPVVINENLSFDNMESALGLALHPDIKCYFTSIYSESFDLSCEEGHFSLLFIWSEADFERLQENLIGHILMKRKLKQSPTVFFALTDDENFILSIENETGAVWVEQVGKAPHKKLAESLSEFLAQATPIIYD
ncbi:SecY-interacting protein [Colwellia sp. MEBiC06753]